MKQLRRGVAEKLDATMQRRSSPIRTRWLRQGGVLASGGVLLVLAVLGLPVDGLAQVGGWSQPINISDSQLGSWFPDIAVDNMGNVHVVWCETEWDEFQRAKEYLYYSQRHGEDWTQPNDIVPASMTIHRGSIAADTLGNLYLLVLDDQPPERPRGIFLRHAPVETAYSAASWSEWRFVGGRPMGYTSDIAVDLENRLHVIYTESVDSDGTDSCPLGGCSDVFYRQSHDGGSTWSAPVNLSQSEPGTKRLALKVDGQGNIHAFWDEGGDRNVPDVQIGVVHTMSRDGGTSWLTPTLITSTVGIVQQIGAGSDGRGQTVVVWRAAPIRPEDWGRTDPRIYYQVSADGISWSAAQPIPGILGRMDSAGNAGYDQYDMVSDSAGNLHLVGVIQLSLSDPTPAVFHLEWDGERWSAPERISQGGGYPEYPRIVVEKGNILHVVWAVKESRPLGAQLIDVWYSTREITAPAWTPVPTPVPRPTPTSTPAPSPVPVLTSYPTLDSSTTGPAVGLDTESDEILQLAISLLPVLLLILVLIVIRVARPRRSRH